MILKRSSERVFVVESLLQIRHFVSKAFFTKFEFYVFSLSLMKERMKERVWFFSILCVGFFLLFFLVIFTAENSLMGDMSNSDPSDSPEAFHTPSGDAKKRRPDQLKSKAKMSGQRREVRVMHANFIPRQRKIELIRGKSSRWINMNGLKFGTAYYQLPQFRFVLSIFFAGFLRGFFLLDILVCQSTG